MKTIHILEDFEGYPHSAPDKSKRQRFVKGEEIEVSDDFAALVIGKGHARAVASSATQRTTRAKGAANEAE